MHTVLQKAGLKDQGPPSVGSGQDNIKVVFLPLNWPTSEPVGVFGRVFGGRSPPNTPQRAIGATFKSFWGSGFVKLTGNELFLYTCISE